jgi:hypothetical protein
MGMSGQRHAPASLYPRGKDPRYPLDKRLGGPHPIVQPVVRHYTAWATAAPFEVLNRYIKLWYESPVAKNLKVTASRSLTVIDFCNSCPVWTLWTQ